MEEWEIDFKEQMLPDEEVIDNISDLEYAFNFVPYQPTSNPAPFLSMRLVLTNRRLVVRFWDGNVRKWFYTSVIYNLTERKINSDKPSWPYQATLMLSAGLVLVMQTQKVDKTQQERLSSLLNRAFLMYSGHRENIDTIAAIIKSEQERRSRQRVDSEKKK